MKTATLFALLLKLAVAETPSPSQKYQAGMQQMTDLYVSVGSEGAIVSKDVDPLILAVMGFEESRHRPNSKDGDCAWLQAGTFCNAIGPMQLSRGTPGMMKNIDPEYQALTVELLRQPDTSVATAYRMLKYWKQACPSSTAALLGTWSAGKCLKKPIEMGNRRCALVKGLADAAGVTFDDCKEPTRDKHMLYLLRALKKETKPEAEKAEPKK